MLNRTNTQGGVWVRVSRNKLQKLCGRKTSSPKITKTKTDHSQKHPSEKMTFTKNDSKKKTPPKKISTTKITCLKIICPKNYLPQNRHPKNTCHENRQRNFSIRKCVTQKSAPGKIADL